MKVLVTLNIPEVGIDMLKEAGLEVEVWRNDRPLTADELVQKSLGVEALLATGSNSIDKEFLNKCKHLKVISQFGAGYDNINVDEARLLGIDVGNAPNAMSDATADIAFILMLTASRKICHLHKSIIAGEWGHFRPRAHLGQELKGKTLGIFGMGRIGLEMALRCKGAYDMKILYSSRNVKQEAEQKCQATRVEFEELLTESDVLSVHCALNTETKGIFDAAVFKKMKRSAIFINTSRGAVHNQKDLYNALVSGDIWGAGLDVTDPEPMAANDPLLGLENVAITPHIGSATISARDQMSMLAAKNIIQSYKGEPLDNLVN